jgi:hypothetical protein
MARGYYYKLKQTPGGWGIDYFKDDKPIQNWEYEQGTGINTSELEQKARQWQGGEFESWGGYYGWPSYADQGQVAGAEDYYGGGGGGGTATGPTYTYWMGQRYDLNNPDEAEAYANARRGFIEEQYGYGFGRGQKSIEEQQKTWGEDYLKQLGELGQAKEKRDVGIARYFSAIAPAMYQSAEGVNLAESQRLLKEGKAEAGRQKGAMETKLSDWWEDYKRQLLQQKQQELDEVYNALSQAGSTAVQSRIGQMATPGTPTTSPLNIAKYFDLMGQAVGQIPGKIGQMSGSMRASLAALLNKISQGIPLTPQERQMAGEYGII